MNKEAVLARIHEIGIIPGIRTASGEDTYVLCEINVSSVFAIPDQAPAAIGPYSQAVKYIPQERKTLTFILAKADDGVAPAPRISRAASASRSAVLMPGLTASRRTRSVRATTRPAARISAI